MKPTESGPVGTATVAAEEKLNPIESLNQLFTRNVQRFAEFQKKTVDLAAEQNVEMINTWKKHASASPFFAEILDLQSTAFNRAVETQKAAIDLMVEQSHAWTGFVGERADTATKAIEAGTKFARASIDAARSCGVSVPSSAVTYRTSGTTVQVVRDNVIETRNVQVGIHSGSSTEVRSGLTEGDIVVANAGTSLRDGDRVKPADTDSTNADTR